MFWFKLCPRCTGDLFDDRDQYGSYITCMQCGFSKDMPSHRTGLIEITAESVPAPTVPQSDGSKRRRISHGGRHFSKTFAIDAKAVLEAAA